MVFGYSTNAFKKFSLTEAIEKIARIGFKGAEILGDRPHLYPPDVDQVQIEHLNAVIVRNKIKVTNLNSFTLFAVGDTYLPSWIEPDKDRREIRIRHTLDSLKIAKQIGCPNISIPPGGPLDGLARQEAMHLFHHGLEQVVSLAEELGVMILVEPEPDLMIETTAQFKDFIKDVPSKSIGLNFDIGHFFCVGEDPRRAFEELFQWVGHVHLEDIAPSREHNHLIAGRGAVEFKEVFTSMVQLGYTGDISLELYTYQDTPEQAGRESLDYLRPIFEETGLGIE
ncbi:MAG: sugar phosphate isomerase/epimerase [Desulfobacterales bacterium]|nr:MAG: sugar phosphate isomerase/epimerase [Desulfobacterales bacterium]